MSDLWEFNLDDDEQLSDSDTEAASRKRRGGAGFDAEALLPADKRQKVRRMYGSGGARGMGGSPAGNGGAKAVLIHSDNDSDLELIEQSGARCAAPASAEARRLDAERAAARPALDTKTSLLLARSLASIDYLRRGQDDDEEEDDGVGAGLSQGASPVQLRHGGAVAASPAAAAAAGGSAPKGTKEKKVPTIVLKLETSKGRCIRVRVRTTDTLSKAFDTFRNTALEQGWVDSSAAEIRFEFDGDALGAGDTPESLGMEDEDKIEAHLL